jgi:hypothetical protein
LDYMQQAWEYKENFGETNIENLHREFLLCHCHAMMPFIMSTHKNAENLHTIT